MDLRVLRVLGRALGNQGRIRALGREMQRIGQQQSRAEEEGNSKGKLLSLAVFHL